VTAERRSAELVVGDVYRVRAGGRLAADGVVRQGASSVDQATITGESLPVPKGIGDAVLAGTLNQEGTLDIEVTRPAAESALARIIRALRVAEANRAPMEGAVQRFAAVYTPVVTLLAMAVALVPTMIGAEDAGAWVLRGITLLVIACPCALVIATPVSVVSALAGAARQGLLVRGGAPLEALARVRALAVDKTGTITSGQLSVERVVVEPPDHARALLSRLAALEGRTEHPVARAITEYVGTLGIDASTKVEGFAMTPGLGVAATVDGVVMRAGRDRHVPEAAALFGPPPDGRVQVLVEESSGARAVLLLTDTIRTDAPGLVQELHELGVRPVVMLTGDSAATARAVAAHVGIDDVRAGLLPEEKVDAVRGLRERHGMLAMVGDGVNDAPALATADVGIVMGVAGAPATIETADVALMSDDLAALPRAIRLARRTVRVVRINIGIALVTKLLLGVGTLLGVVSLSVAVLLGDVGATIIVTASALRLADSPRARSWRPDSP
jgi:Cd2+/Zn2+-exporting ATPase